MFQQKKPYSAVTVTIENLTGETYEDDDLSGMPELVEVIKLQSTGPGEAARALRKKLKYGNVHRQIRALVILDGLIQNAGSRFQRAFIDEPLLERLRVCGSSQLSDPDVRDKCRELFRSWAQYQNTPGLERIARLHKELPKRKVAVTQDRSKVLRETEENPFGDDEEEAASQHSHTPSAAGSSNAPAHARTGSGAQAFSDYKSYSGASSFFGSSKEKKKEKEKEKEKEKAKSKRKPFNLEAEKEKMKSVIADSSIAATNLMNSLQSINREKERISENEIAVERFEACKHLRRRVLRYIHHVEQEQWLGGLLHANDELVHALMSFEQLDRSIDADSDSDDELAEQAHLYRMATLKGKEAMSNPGSPVQGNFPDVSGLSIAPAAPAAPAAPPRPPPGTKPSRSPPPPVQPPRPALQSDSEDDDEDNPFGDQNETDTPAHENEQPRW